MKFTAVGDALMQRRMPKDYKGFQEVRDYIGRGDFRFCNLETTLNREGECYASQYSGGTWLRADPEILEDIRAYGFNVLSFNNNHTMDYGYNGLLKTLEAVRNYGFVNSGVGENLSRAAAPAYLDTPKGRVAIISVVSTFHPASMAGEQGRRVPGRPGVNGLHVSTRYIVRPEQLEMIRTVAAATGVNVQNDIERAEGYYPPLPEGCAAFGDLLFEVGETPGIRETICEADMNRVEKAIYEAQFQADYIMVSLHAHECKGEKVQLANFIPEFARRCIDSGAHGVIGHGPHLLRGVEVYKNRPIFYSLGDFMTQVESGSFAPEDFYAKYGLTSDATMHELFKTRSHDFTLGLMTKRECFETVIPLWEMENGELTHLELMPLEMGFELPRSQSGFPVPAKGTAILEHLADISKPFGTEMKIEKGIAVIRL